MISQSALLPKFFGLSVEEITQLATKCSQLKQTLTEIKEIAERVKVYDPLTKQILQKISEVEND